MNDVYIVCYIDISKNIESVDFIDNNQRKVFLRKNERDILFCNMSNHFESYENALLFANMAFNKTANKHLIAIYNITSHKWLKSWIV